VLARVAENIYWLSRYLERAQSTVRLINRHSNLLLDLPTVEEEQGWLPLIAINGLYSDFIELHQRASEQAVCGFVIAEPSNPSSLVSAISGIHFNLRSCRDVLPRATYESINSTIRFVTREAEGSYRQSTSRQHFLTKLEQQLLAIDGSMNSNMCHDLGYRMMRMGCYLERADMTTRIIDVQSSALSDVSASKDILALQDQRWVSVLRSAAAHQMYRQHVRRPVNGTDTLTFLLTNETLPRSYRFCIDHLDDCARAIGNNNLISEAVMQLRERVDMANFSLLSRDRQQLHSFLDNLQLGMIKVGGAIATAYFPPAQDS